MLHNPSFIWRGMWAVQSILKQGCRRSIGNGVDTIIGSDPWLPVDEHPYVQSALHESIYEAPVSSLLNEQVSESRKIIGLGTGIRREITLLNHAIKILHWWLLMVTSGLKFGVYMFHPRRWMNLRCICLLVVVM